MPDVVVVGAGLSGLACARRLRRNGLEVAVLESGSRPGGVVWTERVDGYLVEAGPNTILPTSASMAMIDEAGIGGELVTAPPGAPRFVYIGGLLRRVPWVLSARGTLRALAEPLIPRRRKDSDESLASFFERRFGRETHERLAAPFATGIYAGDTAELGTEGVFPRFVELERSYGSVILGMLRNRRRGSGYRLASFRDGMGRLSIGLAEGLDLRYSEEVRVLEGGWTVESPHRTLRARAVVVAVPAYAASRLLGPLDGELGELMDGVCYAPIVVASLSAANTDFQSPLEGFGFLVPRGEGPSVLGTLFNSCLFPGRAPEGRSLFTSFIGGRLSPETVDWPDDRIWATVSSDVERVLQLPAGASRPVRLIRYRRAIPQYRLEHRKWVARVEARLARQPGLFLTGNYLGGVSVPAAMEHGGRTADAVTQYVRRVE